MTIEQLPPRPVLLASLSGFVCPICGRKKAAGHTFCAVDYMRLKPTTQENLYRKIGHGYAESLAAALNELGVEKLGGCGIMPAG